jgi:TetR/AcrR family transcriptional repressor of nem operon
MGLPTYQMVGNMPPMDTRQTLLDHAADLVRTRGYNGFSYADLAERVGIRKASIHHHFPAKEDLGVALVEQYIQRFDRALSDIRAIRGASARLRTYVAVYRESLDQNWSCLCGMLASEVEVVPPAVVAGVRRFMEHNIAWLTDVIAAGQEEGEVRRELDPRASATALLSMCQGALLVARSMQDASGFDRAVAPILDFIRTPG